MIQRTIVNTLPNTFHRFFINPIVYCWQVITVAAIVNTGIDKICKRLNQLCECKLSEEYDNMILCDLCGQWFHFRCVEYDTSLSTSNELLCRLCTPPAAKKPKMYM